MQPTAPFLQPVEQKDLGARENRKTRITVEQRRSVAPIARAVLQPDNRLRIGPDQAADQVEREPDHRHWRDVVEKELQRRRADLVDDAGNECEDAVVADPLVVEGRQHQHPAAAVVDRVAHQRRGIGHRAGAGPGHQLLRRDPGLDQPVEQFHPLAGRHRVRLARRAEDRQPARTLVEQPAAERDKPTGVGFATRGERGQDRDQHSAEWLRRHVSGSSGATPLRATKRSATGRVNSTLQSAAAGPAKQGARNCLSFPVFPC